MINLIPSEILALISSFLITSLWLNKDIYEVILKEEHCEYWYLKYVEFMTKNNVKELIYKKTYNPSYNWKKFYILATRFNRWDLFVDSLNKTILDLSNSQLDRIPPEISTLIHLKELYLFGNLIKIIPKDIGSLVNLKVLTLGDNKITIIPPEFGELVNLKEWLDLSHNQIEVLPKEFGKLVNLEWLNLTGNYITVIPEEFKCLVNLKTLFLCNNKVKAIPSEIIIYLENLDMCMIRNNPVKVIPEELSHINIII